MPASRQAGTIRLVTAPDRLPNSAPALPTLEDSKNYIRGLKKDSVVDVLRRAHERGQVAVQPRCGVGAHDKMFRLLRDLEKNARPDILTITIDSHTRLKRFTNALRTLNTSPGDLNGYPLVTHGWMRGRELNESVAVPLEIRHGSPDPRILFEVSIAAGITSFEGGGVSYNLPYAKDVPIAQSLACWREVDAACGDLARDGIVVDRELFGTLTAVLVPPSISIAISIIEAHLAAQEGVRCISIAYPQGGNVVQDVAALRAIRALASQYLPADVEVYPVLHEFMGVFPRRRPGAEELIFLGALVARLGGAAKVITKTHQEAFGIPDASANIAGMNTAHLANSSLLDFITVDGGRVDEEKSWIQREVAELVEPILESSDPYRQVVSAFGDGSLDIPFSASKYSRSEVIPCRDHTGAIRYMSHGALPFSDSVWNRNRHLADRNRDTGDKGFISRIMADVNYFVRILDHD